MAKKKEIEKSEPRGLQRLSREEWPSPFSFARRFVDEMDRMFEEFGFGRGRFSRLEYGFPRGAWMPPAEIFQRENQLVVRADLPGLSKDDLKVEITDNAITIQGERRTEHDEKQEGYYRSERSYGKFYRQLPLPEGVKTDNATAAFRDGVLEITMQAPKREERKARKLEIQGETELKAKAKAAGR